MSVLVCGGAGYIGSHTCIELIMKGFDVIIADNLSNSSREVINRIEYITGAKITFEEIELCNIDEVNDIFNKYPNINAVINFAGLKSVGESTKYPIMYYENNLISAINIIKCMEKHNIYNLVFSSSATVYGEAPMPVKESCPTGAVTNPYGATKLFIENILCDCCRAEKKWNIAILRYFNPIGAHESGLIGEDPKGIPNNLVPYIAKVAIGELDKIHIYGDDYPTVDGTGVRDYIHVVDLAKGHIAALNKLKQNCGLIVYNLGTGKGYSVKEVIRAYEKACNNLIPYVIDDRRTGDIAVCYADPKKAYDELGWKAELDINAMCQSSWKWQQMNPNGYR